MAKMADAKDDDFSELIELTIGDASKENKFICNALMLYVENIPIEISSVNGTRHEYKSEHNVKINNAQHELLSKIPLKTHLLRAYAQTILLFTENKPANFVAILAAVALCHDIGKIPSVEAKFKGQNGSNHEEISISWLNSFFEEAMGNNVVSLQSIALIAETIKGHHIRKEDLIENPKKTKQVLSEYVSCFRQVDEMTRKAEIVFLSKQNKMAEL